MNETPTKAGLALLQRYLADEAKGHLVPVTLRDGSKAQAMTLRYGQGAEKAAAVRLRKQGFAIVDWNWARKSRLLVITPAGREAAQPDHLANYRAHHTHRKIMECA